MKKVQIYTAALLLTSMLALSGCGDSKSSSQSAAESTTAATTEAASTEETTAEQTTATEASTTTTEAAAETTTAEIPTDAAPIAVEGSFPCENIGLTINEAIEKFGKEPEYTMFVEPPRLSVSFGDGARYATSEESYDKNQKINEVLFNDMNGYTAEIIPGLKLGMNFDDIKKTYPLSEPNTSNLNGTYLSSFSITCGGKEMIVYVDFGDDSTCACASFVQIIAAQK